MVLTQEQIEEFHNTGYLAVRGLYSPEEIKNYQAWTTEVSHYPEEPGKYMMFFEENQLHPGERILSRMEDIEPYHEGFRKLFTSDRMQGAVSELLGEPAVLFKDKINFKLPGANGFKAHQDVQAGWDRYAELHITALVSIDACTLENGCLELVGRQHKKGLIGESWKPLDEDALNYVPIPTDPGDALFFDSFTPHRSAPNLTSAPRRVLYVTYNKLSEGDHRRQYYADKRRNYPPDCEREPDKQYVFRV